jgi:hypothetical protein
MTNAVLGAGTQLKLSDDASPEVFTLIAEVLNMGAVGATAPEVDVTNLDSTSKEYIGGLPDGESVEFELNFLDTNVQHEDLRDSVGDTRHFQLVFSDTSEADFLMVVLGFSRSPTTPEEQLKATVTGRITGDITWS